LKEVHENGEMTLLGVITVLIR